MHKRAEANRKVVQRSRFDPSPQQLAAALMESADASKAKPRFGAPSGKEDFPIGSVSNRDLGDLMVRLAKAISAAVVQLPYNATNSQIVNWFLERHAQEVFCLCNEAIKRGTRLSTLPQN